MRALAALFLLALSGMVPVAAAPTLLQQLTLRDAEALFSERNRELQMARRAVDSAEADILSANARPNPTLSVNSAASPTTGLGAGSWREKRIDTSIGISQVFERGNKRELRTDAARYTAAAVEKDRADVERQQRVQLHATYFDLVLAQDRLRISSETAGLYQKTTDAAERRLKAGDIAPADLARINVDALRAANDARAAQAELERARIALAYMIGAEKEAAQLRAADTWPDALPPDPALDMDRALANRADVLAAQERINAAQKNRDLALALRTRDVTAGVQYERFPGDTTNNSVGIAFSVPLFTNYYYQGEIRRAETELLTAEDHLGQVRAQALSEISANRSLLLSSLERVQRFRDVLLAAAQKAADSAEFAYTRGAIGVMDLLDARRQLYATRLEAAAVFSDYAKTLAAWRATLALAPPSPRAYEKPDFPQK
jgi:cobalt-zinc-cadmium efflux system outer membrane protein